jgi:aryl-alcohol dehydrogenase-like predicted oxidoreductase
MVLQYVFAHPKVTCLIPGGRFLNQAGDRFDREEAETKNGDADGPNRAFATPGNTMHPPACL